MLRRLGPTLAIAILALTLTASGVLAATTATTSPAGGGFQLTLTGSAENDRLSIRGPGPGLDGRQYFFISDPGGVDGGVPPCFRFSATEIHCLADEVAGFTIVLGDGNDVLEIEGEFAEELNVDGGAGNDELNLGGGDDIADGGAGDDIIRAGSGDDRIDGGAGDDNLVGGAGADRLNGGAGRDTLAGGAGNDRLGGGAGRDRLAGGSGRDRVSGGPARDRCSGGSGRNRLSGCP